MMKPDNQKELFPAICYICGKVGEKLLHPDALTINRSIEDGCILCNYCHRPVCLQHISSYKIKRLLRIRPQLFCMNCVEILMKSSSGHLR